MSREIEERVVEMRFDNQDFERNIKTSMSTLDDLKKALNMDGVTEGLENIEKATKGIDFSGISSGIDLINEKFSALGVAGMKIVSNLVDDAYQFIKKTALAIPQFFTSGIVQGGIKRAMNIEQAKFQIEGLGKEWEDVYDDIDYAVSGTAYGLDAAAKAASQLIASGVEFGATFGDTGNSPMAKALRGISGVAAMTNRDYDEISRIFTTVAGNGRMMGDQLNQLGERGINAAATLKDFFNGVVDGSIDAGNVSESTLKSMAHAMEEFGIESKVTEADIREMASKSLISFDIFSEAMDNAFGEHAKDANKTFTGAMSNIKAALSRVGADYISPLIKMDSNIVRFLNSVRVKINEFRSNVSSKVAPLVSGTILGIARHLSEFVDSIDFSKIDLTKPFIAFKNVLTGVWNILKGVWSVLKPIGEAFTEVFTPIAGDTLIKIAVAFRQFTEKLRLSYSDALNLKEAFKGLFSIIDMIGHVLGVVIKIGVKILGTVLKPVFTLLGKLGKVLLSVSAVVGKALQIADEWVKNNITYSKVIEVAQKVLGAFVMAAKNAFATLAKVMQPVMDVLRTFKEIVELVLSNVKAKIEDFVKNTLGIVEVPKGLKDLIGYFKTFFGTIGTDGKAFVKSVGDFFVSLFSSSKDVGTYINNLKTTFLKVISDIVDFFTPIIEKVKDFVSIVKEVANFEMPDLSKYHSFKQSAVGIFDSIVDSIHNVIDAFHEFAEEKIGIPEFSLLTKFKEYLVQGFDTTAYFLRSAVRNIGKFFDFFLGKIDFSKVASIKEKIVGVFGSIKEAITGLFTKDVTREIIPVDMLTDTSKLETFKENFIKIMKSISEFLNTAFANTSITDIIDTVINFFLAKNVIQAYRTINDILSSISGFIKKIKDGDTDFNKLLQSITGMFNSFGGIGNGIKDTLDVAKTSLKDFSNSLKASTLQKLGIAILTLAGALVVLALIPADDLKRALSALVVLVTALGGLMALDAKLMKSSTTVAKQGETVAKNGSIATTLLALGATVILLASALKTLSEIEDLDKLEIAVLGLTTIMGELAGLIIVMDKFGNGKTSLGQGAGFTLMAFGVKKMADTMVILSKIDPDKALQGITAITVIMTEMIAAFKLLENTDNMLKSASAMVILSAAMLVMAGSVAVMGSIDPVKLEQGLTGIAVAIGIMVAALLLVNNSNAVKAASAMVIMSAAMLIMAGAIAVMGSIKPDVLAQGLEAIGVSLAMMTASLMLINNGNAVKAAAAMVVMSAALLILSGVVAIFGVMNPDMMAQGLIGIGAAMVIFVAAVKSIDNDNVLKASAAMVVFAAAMVVMSGAVALMGAMSAGNMAQGLLGIAGAVTVFVLAVRALKGAEATMLAFAGGLALIGLAVGLVGAGLLAFALALDLIAVSGVAAALVLAQMGKILIESLLNIVVELADSISEAVSQLIQIAVDALIENADIIVEGALTLIETILAQLIDHGPIIVDMLMEFLITTLQTFSERFPELLTVVMDLIGTFFTMVMDRLSQTDPSYLIGALEMLAGVSALIVALNFIGPMIPTAMLYLLAMGGFVAELAGLLAALGALNSIPGLQEFVEKGGELLSTIGHILGDFVGNVVGGIAEGITDSFPQIGQNLSDFWTNAETFITGASSIDGSSFDGIKSLVEAMLLLTANDLLDGIISFFGGGNTSLADFADELSAFAPKFIDFANQISSSNINTSAVESSANALKIMADAADSIGNKGGLLADLVGENSLSEFAEELKAFAPAIVYYSKYVDGRVSESAVQSSANALKIMTEAAGTIENQGGFLADVLGDNTLSTFADELKAFAPGIVYYSKYVDGRVSESAVQASANALKIMADAAGAIENQGGLLADVFGDNTLSAFAEDLKVFGPAIADYSSAVDGKVNSSSIRSSATAIEGLINMAHGIQNSGGLVSLFTGDNDLATFGNSLSSFGTSLSNYSSSIETVDTAKMEGASTQIQTLINIANGISAVDMSQVATFANNMKTFALNGLNGFVEAFNDSNAETTVDTSVTTLVGFTTSALMTHTTELKDGGKSSGETVMVGISEGFESKKTELQTTVSNICKNDIIYKVRDLLTKKVFSTYSSLNVCGGLISGMNESASNVSNAMKTLCNAIVSEAKNTLKSSEFQSIGKSVISGLSTGVNDISYRAVLSSAVTSVYNSIVNAFTKNPDNKIYWDMYNIGRNVITGLKDGINSLASNLMQQAYDLASNIPKTMAKGLQVKSPSRKTFRIGEYTVQGLINGFISMRKELYSEVDDTAGAILSPFQEAVSEMYELVNTGIDAEPTIRPVMDLTEIQNGVDGINGMFSNGFNLSGTYARALSSGIIQDGITPENSRFGSTTTNYNYTQNNYSPKALSRSEIYRQTRNQFSTLKGAAG